MKLGKGDKYKAASLTDDGIIHRESINEKAKLRQDTGMAQRPKAKTETVSSDRGSFKNRC
jgi:hypothetical protein